MKRERRALLKNQIRHFAASVLENISPIASSRFDDLNLTEEEMFFVEEELQAIALRLSPATKSTVTSPPTGLDDLDGEKKP